MKPFFKQHEGLVIVLVLLSAILTRLWLIHLFPGYVEDHGFFMEWVETLRAHGLGKSYEADPLLNYPPVFVAILRGYTLFLDVFDLTLTKGGFWVRLPSLLCDLFLCLVYLLLTRQLEAGKRLLGLVFLAFNPALIYGGPVWGQIDALHSTFLVLAIALIRKPAYSGMMYGLALLTKFQSIMIAPVIGYCLLIQTIQGRSAKDLVQWTGGLLLPVTVIFGYFAMHGTLDDMLRQGYLQAVDTYPYLSLNALNLWYALFANPWTFDNLPALSVLTYKHVGYALVALAGGLILHLLGKKKPLTVPNLNLAGACMILSFYLFSTQMHERYIIPAIVLLCMLVAHQPGLLAAAIPLTLTTTVNLVLVTYNQMQLPIPKWLVYVNLASFIWLLFMLSRKDKPASHPNSRRVDRHDGFGKMESTPTNN